MPIHQKVGDLLYARSEEGFFHVIKLLRIQANEDGVKYHAIIYQPVSTLPPLNQLDKLQVANLNGVREDLHGFEFWINRTVTEQEEETYLNDLKERDFLAWCRETGRDPDTVREQAVAAAKRADEAFDQEDYDTAISLYMEAVNHFPPFWQAIDNMALAKLNKGRFHDAIDDFRWSLKLNENNAMAEGAIGECYYRLGDYASAVEQFDRSLALNPSDDKLALKREKALFLQEGGDLADLEAALNPAPEPEPIVEEAPVEVPIQQVAEETIADEPAFEPEPEREEPPQPEPKKAWWPFKRKK